MFSLVTRPPRKPDLELKHSLAVRTEGRRDEIGLCVDCGEWTDVGASCCGRGVWFEGGFVADLEEGE